MRSKQPERHTPIPPRDWRKMLPFMADEASDQEGWVGLEAVRYHAIPAFEIDRPALTHHTLVLIEHPPEELDILHEGLTHHASARSIVVVPAGSPVHVRASKGEDVLIVDLDPRVVEHVATEGFDLGSARLTIPLLGGIEAPDLRAAMLAVGAELTAGGTSGRLAAESLAKVVAIRMIRTILSLGGPGRARADRREPKPSGTLSPARLRTVVEYIEAHLDSSLTVNNLAGVAHLSPFHFARQFKAAAGLPPHEYLIARRVKRALQLLQPEGDLSLAEIAASAGFSDQSQFSHHFKRVVGVTPGQFRKSARTA